MKKRLLPGLYYGWIITLVGFVVLTIIYGYKLCFGTLFGALLDEFGWSRAVVTSIFSLAILVQAVLQPLGGALLDKFGPRRMLAAGGLFMCISLVTFGRAHSLWSIYLSYGLFFSLANVVAGFVANTTMVSHWFNKKRGLAIGIVSAGTSLGLFIFNPLLAYLIDIFGWRLSLQLLGIVSGILIAAVALILVKDGPEDVGQFMDGLSEEDIIRDEIASQAEPGEQAELEPEQNWTFKDALQTRDFWLLFIGYIGYLFAWYALANHAVMAMCDMGLSRLQAATIYAYTGLSGAISGMLCAWLADYLRDRKYMVIAACLLLGTTAFILARAGGHIGLLYFAVIILGMGHGGGVLMSAVTADRFGVIAMGKIWGTVSMAGLLGGAMGPVVVGYIYDVMNSYSLAWTMVIVICILSLLCLAGVRRIPGKFNFLARDAGPEINK